METIAITNWNDIVSPMYDASCCFVIVKPDGIRKVVDVRKISLIDKADLCRQEGVEVIICGAISNIAAAMLLDKKIKVHSWIRGPIDEVIWAYQNHVNLHDCFAMPGCGRKMCHGQKGFRHRDRKCGKSEKHLESAERKVLQ